MKDELKNKYIDRYFKISEEAAKLTSQSAQILHHMKQMGEIIGDIYTEGYTAGLAEGKKNWANIKKN